MTKNNQFESQSVQLEAQARGAENFLRWSRFAMLRGGRVTKFKGVAASYAPELGLVTSGAGQALAAGGGLTNQTLGMARRLLRWSVAPVALLAASSPAFAPAFAQAEDECVQDASGEFVCQDNGDPATTTQVLGGLEATPVVGVIEDGFDIDTSGTGTRGLQIANAEGISVTLADGASSTIIGSTDGVRLDNEDDGAINAVLGNATGLTGNGVYAINSSSNGGGLVLDTTAGSVAGNTDGIRARNTGNGDTMITTGDVTGITDDGVSLEQRSAGNVVVDTTAGTVVALDFGISVSNVGGVLGGGQNRTTTITTADVFGFNAGIRAENFAGDVVIDSSAGDVSSFAKGIEVRNSDGTGDVLVITGDVTTDSGNAIEVTENDNEGGSGGADISIDSSAGSVSGGDAGIFARNIENGDLSIVTADVNGESGNGIDAVNNGADTGDLIVDSTAGAVTGSDNGVFARNNGSGDTSITTADVDGEGSDGISVANAASAGDLTVDSSAGTVRGQYSGIVAVNSGTGATTIITADIDRGNGESGQRDAIRVRGGANTTDLTIDTTAGRVVGQSDGIDAETAGTGILSITTGDVIGENNFGIRVETQRDGGDLLIDSTAGNVSGQQAGINVFHRGENAAIRTGNVNSAGGTGVEFTSGIIVGAVSVDTSGGRIAGQSDGINFYSGTRVGASIVTGDVEGTDGNGIEAEVRGELGTGADLTIDSSAGSVTGGTNGILASHEGSGALSITTADVTGESANGIDATSFTEGLVIDSTAGAVTGGDNGIRAANNGTGDTSITTADVTGESGDGIYVRNFDGSANLIIDSTVGAVTGGAGGINAANIGTGTTTITTANVTGLTGSGISFGTGSNAGDIAIDTSAGSVTGATFGIGVSNFGTGDATLITGDVTGETVVGITINDDGEGGTYGADMTIDTSAGSVSGPTGINASNFGTGDLSITTADVTGTSFNGIVAINRDIGTGDLTIDTSAGAGGSGVSSYDDAIFARNNGTGITQIVTADVTSGNGDGEGGAGIDVISSDDAAGLEIDTSAGTVTGDADGILARSYGGNASIVTADVSAYFGDGINIRDDGEGSDGVDISIDTAAGSVTGGEDGIDAFNVASGDLSIVTGDVSGTTGSGIRAQNQDANGGDLTIDSTAGTVSSDINDGINVTQNGSGFTSVTTADVAGGGEGSQGIEIRATGSGIFLASTAGEVTSLYETGGAAIYVRNQGTGAATITTADVTSASSEAIDALNNGDATDLVIDTTAGAVSGDDNGILATNLGTGITSVTTGDVDATRFDGINVSDANEGGGGVAGDVLVDTTAGTVTGGLTGITALNTGAGSLNIAAADVSGAVERGIRANNQGASAGDLTIDSTAGAISGAIQGISAVNSGTGDTTITTANVSASNGPGIDVENRVTAGNVSVDTVAGDVTASSLSGIGIRVENDGAGTIAITTGNVFGSSGGVQATNAAGSGDITIDTLAGSVEGGFAGIAGYNSGNGAQTITTANVSSYAGTAIYAGNGATSTDIVIDSTAGDLTGSSYGIVTINYGTGVTSITTANVTGTSNLGDGINARNIAGSGAIVIDSTAGSVSGGDDAIDVRNEGSGDTSITTADVTGENGSGVYVYNDSDAGNVNVDTTAGAVTADNTGVEVRQFGDGDVTITTANVTAGFDGVYVYGGFGSGALMIDTTAGAVAGGDNGIDVFSYGYDDVSITTSDVSGGDEGIRATTYYGDLTINSVAGTVSGGSTGILVNNSAQNDQYEVSIVTADVSGTTGDGINVENGYSSGSISIDSSAGTVTGGNKGISAYNRGYDQALTIVTGDVTGQAGAGINASDYGERAYGAGDISIDGSAGAVTGATDGIIAENRAFGDLVITTGDVTGSSGEGIAASNIHSTTGALTIDSSAGAVRGAADGIDANNFGTGALSITTADVTGNGAGNFGIDAANFGTDLIIDTTAGTVIGDGAGIGAFNSGTGSTSLVTGDVSALEEIAGEDGGDGVYVLSDVDAGAVTVDTAAGSVNATGSGITVRQYGAGDVAITAANVTATAGDGITVADGGEGAVGAGAISIDSSAGAVVGGERGISAFNSGDGALTLTTADVTSGDAQGILASNEGTGLVINTAAGTVTGASRGIEAENNGTGSTLIEVADVTGLNDDAINFENSAATTGDVTIVATGTVRGANDGIEANNNGSGSIFVETNSVYATDFDGIDIDTGEESDAVTITAAGPITAGDNGLEIDHEGSGAVTITTADVTADDDGIQIDSSGAGLTLDTTAGSVTGGDSGIDVGTYGAGDVAITTADVTGGLVDGIDVSASDLSGDIAIDSTAGTVSGSRVGVNVSNDGAGSLSVLTGDVRATNIIEIEGFVPLGGIGIDVTASENAGDITVDSSAGTVDAAGDGINVVQYGLADVAVITADVNSDRGVGVFVTGSLEGLGDEGSISIDTSAGAVTSAADGIVATNAGTGDLTITTADITTAARSGILATNGSGTATIDTLAGSVTGVDTGISVRSIANGGLVSITTANVTAAQGEGISVTQEGDGDVIINSTAGSITAATSGVAIDNQGAGNISVQTANVTTSGGDGVNMVTDVVAGALDIDTSAGAIVGGDRGISAEHGGSDDLTITVGNVTGQGAEGILASTTQDTANILIQGGAGIDSNVIGATNGIAATTQGADITIAGLTSVTGQAGDGLNLVSNGGDIAVSDIGTITGLGGNGIFASSNAGDITIENVGMIGGITATDGIGIAAYADNGGTITIGTSGAVSGNTYGLDGAANGAGDITIDTRNYGVNAAIGIRAANSGEGDTRVTTADVTGTGGEAVLASAAGGNVAVNSVAGSLIGLTDGVMTSNTGTGSTTITTADVTGTTDNGIDAYTGQMAGAVAIDTSAGAVSGGMNGVFVRHNGAGSATITTADVTGTARDGIDAQINGGGASDLAIDSSAGLVTGGRNGITASHTGAGTLSITAGNTTGANGDGIAASVASGDLIVTASGSVSGSNRGVFAVNSAMGSTTLTLADATGVDGAGIAIEGGANNVVTSTGTVSGSVGIMETGALGTLSVSANAVQATQARAISLGSETTQTSMITLTTTGAVSGTTEAIYVRGRDISIAASGPVTGGTVGIYGRSDGPGSLAIAAADVTGLAGDGIYALSEGEGLTIDTASGTITGAEDGIDTRNQGTGALAITTADVVGNMGAGINATNAGTTTTIDTLAGSVTGTSAGIFVDQMSAGALSLSVNEVTGGIGIDTNATSGDTQIILGSTAVVTGTSGFGIDARSTGGDIAIRGSSGSVQGATDGIYVRPSGGDIAVSQIDRVEGQSGDGLNLVSGGGAITVRAIGEVVGGGRHGIFADATGGVGGDIVADGLGDVTGAVSGIAAATDGAGTITLGLSGNTTGTQTGVDVSSAGGAVTITNSGSLSGGAFAVSASSAATGAITLNNAGTLANAIQFASADDRLENTGTFTAIGASDFGEGDDTLINTGTVQVVGAAQFDWLESFQSSGVLSLADLNAGSTFTTSGDFVGNGGQVVLDVDFANGVLDQLLIGGAATGSSTISLNPLGAGLVFDQAFTIVQAGAGTQATAFALEGGEQAITGFVDAQLSFDATNNSFFFELAFNERVFEGAKLAENAQNLWHRSSDVWSDARSNSRDEGSVARPVWAVAYGVTKMRDETFSDSAITDGVAVLDYTQDFFGIQAGADFALTEAFSVGVTGGYMNSTARQDASGHGVNFDVLNIGLSASYAMDGFFADLLAKVDTISGNLSDPTTSGFSGNLDGTAYGVRAVAGYRIGSESFYVEPRVGFDLQQTDLDDLVIENQLFDITNVKGARGNAGVRVGGRTNKNAGMSLGYYLEANAVREFEGRADVRFSIGNGAASFQNNPVRTFANVQAGLSLDNGGPLSGFVEVEGDMSSTYESYGAKAGVSFKF